MAADRARAGQAVLGDGGPGRTLGGASTNACRSIEHAARGDRGAGGPPERDGRRDDPLVGQRVLAVARGQWRPALARCGVIGQEGPCVNLPRMVPWGADGGLGGAAGTVWFDRGRTEPSRNRLRTATGGGLGPGRATPARA